MGSDEGRLVPADLSVMECAVVQVVLARIKQRVLEGVPSGRVIDQALEEVELTALGRFISPQ